MSPSSHTAAVQNIYEQHHSWLHGWLKGKLHNACDAADVAHDTFVRILGGRHAAQIVEPRDYLATIARGLVIDRYRRHAIEQAYKQTLAERPEAIAISEEDKAIILQTLAELDQLLDGLPSPVKRAFLLAQVDGLSYAEIGAQLGISIATVKRHLNKAALRCYFVL